MKPGLVCIILFLSLKSYSQVTIKNTSLIKPDTNALIYDVENYLNVAGSSSKVNLVSSAGNAITDEGNNRFKVDVNSKKPETLLVFSGKKLLLEKNFFIDTSSNIKVQLGNIASDTATIAEILANRGLRVTTNSLYNASLRVLSFRINLISPSSGILYTSDRIEGNLLTTEQQNHIKSLTPNCKIVFENVIVSFCWRREMLPFAIVVK
jgi:hypothetical protein